MSTGDVWDDLIGKYRGQSSSLGPIPRQQQAMAEPSEEEVASMAEPDDARSAGDAWDALISKHKQRSDPSRKRYSPAHSAATAIADALSLGYSDELAAAIRAAEKRLQGDERGYAAIYGEELLGQQDVKEQSMADNPGAATAGSIIGAVGSAAIPFAKVAQAPTLVAKTLRGAGAGGALSAAYGFGSGTTLKDRLRRALQGGLVGMATGAALAPVAAGTGRLASKIYGYLKTGRQAARAGVPRRSIQKVNEALKEDVQTGQVRPGSRGDMLMNLGPSLSSAAEGIATQPGRGANILFKAAREQADEEGPRIKRVVSRTLGRDRGRVADAAEVEAERKAAGRLYETAKASQVPVYTQKIRDALDSAVAETDGKTRRALESLRDLRIFKSFPDKKDTRRSAMDLHAARIDIDDMIADAGGSKTNLGRLLGGIRREVDDALKQSVPDYAQADIAYRGALRSREALEEGRDVFKQNMSPQELRAHLKGMPPQVRQRYIKGARDAISQMMGTARNDALKVRTELFEKGWNREKLSILIGPSRAGQIARALEQSANRYRGRQNLQEGSRTAMRQAAQRRFPGQVDASRMEAQLAKTTLSGAGLTVLVKFANAITGGAVASRINRFREGTNAGAARLLAAGDNSQITRDDVIRILVEAERTKKRALNVKEQYDALVQALGQGGTMPARQNAGSRAEKSLDVGP
jgi:hypothetical protein